MFIFPSTKISHLKALFSSFSHLLTFSSSHLLIFSPSHLLIFSFSPFLIFSSPFRPKIGNLLFQQFPRTVFHVYISFYKDFAPKGAILLVFSPSHLLTFTSSHFLIAVSSEIWQSVISIITADGFLCFCLLLQRFCTKRRYSPRFLTFSSSHLHIFSFSNRCFVRNMAICYFNYYRGRFFMFLFPSTKILHQKALFSSFSHFLNFSPSHLLIAVSSENWQSVISTFSADGFYLFRFFL